MLWFSEFIVDDVVFSLKDSPAVEPVYIHLPVSACNSLKIERVRN